MSMTRYPGAYLAKATTLSTQPIKLLQPLPMPEYVGSGVSTDAAIKFEYQTGRRQKILCGPFDKMTNLLHAVQLHSGAGGGYFLRVHRASARLSLWRLTLIAGTKFGSAIWRQLCKLMLHTIPSLILSN